LEEPCLIERRERKELGKHQNDASDSSKPFMQYIIKNDAFLNMCDCGITVTDTFKGGELTVFLSF